MTKNQNKLDRHAKLNNYIRNRIQTKLFKSGTTEKYIHYCCRLNETLKNEPNILFEKHHIVPKFCGGTDAKENIVLLTPSQHVLVHLLRFLEFGKTQDFFAYIFFFCRKSRQKKRNLKKKRKELFESAFLRSKKKCGEIQNVFETCNVVQVLFCMNLKTFRD